MPSRLHELAANSAANISVTAAEEWWMRIRTEDIKLIEKEKNAYRN